MRHCISSRPRTQQPPSFSREGQQLFCCLPREMSVCQSHTTTKNKAFVFNLVVSSPEGERTLSQLWVCSKFVKINCLIHHYYSSLRLDPWQNFLPFHTLQAMYQHHHKTKSRRIQRNDRGTALGLTQQIRNSRFTGLGHRSVTDV